MNTIDSSRISSTRSTRISLESIRNGKHNLSERRASLLNRVPRASDWARFSKGTVSNKDLAYLTAATGHEFALLRGKNEDILFHGSRMHCEFDDLLLDMLKSGKLELICHSHPGEEIPVPSDADKLFIGIIGQDDSIVISGMTGVETEYDAMYEED